MTSWLEWKEERIVEERAMEKNRTSRDRMPFDVCICTNTKLTLPVIDMPENLTLKPSTPATIRESHSYLVIVSQEHGALLSPTDKPGSNTIS